MKFYVKTIMRGEFPSGRDTTLYEVPENVYDEVVEILLKNGKEVISEEDECK